MFFEIFHIASRNGEAIFLDVKISGNNYKIPAARASGFVILTDLYVLTLRDLAALQASERKQRVYSKLCSCPLTRERLCDWPGCSAPLCRSMGTAGAAARMQLAGCWLWKTSLRHVTLGKLSLPSQEAGFPPLLLFFLFFLKLEVGASQIDHGDSAVSSKTSHSSVARWFSALECAGFLTLKRKTSAGRLSNPL